VTRSRLAVCKNEKNEGSAKTGSCHLPPGHFVRAAWVAADVVVSHE
jgi:hypothetical protein